MSYVIPHSTLSVEKLSFHSVKRLLSDKKIKTHFKVSFTNEKETEINGSSSVFSIHYENHKFTGNNFLRRITLIYIITIKH